MQFFVMTYAVENEKYVEAYDGDGLSERLAKMFAHNAHSDTEYENIRIWALYGESAWRFCKIARQHGPWQNDYSDVTGKILNSHNGRVLVTFGYRIDGRA